MVVHKIWNGTGSYEESRGFIDLVGSWYAFGLRHGGSVFARDIQTEEEIQIL